MVSTLFALVLERRREIGLLRYLGLSTAEVRGMVFYEAAYIGGLGGLSGVIAGILLALLLIFVINRQAFGWLIELHMPWDFLGEAIVLVGGRRTRRGHLPGIRRRAHPHGRSGTHGMMRFVSSCRAARGAGARMQRRHE